MYILCFLVFLFPVPSYGHQDYAHLPITITRPCKIFMLLPGGLHQNILKDGWKKGPALQFAKKKLLPSAYTIIMCQSKHHVPIQLNSLV